MGKLIAFALCLLTMPAAAAPARVASLGQCTDELVLLLARPGQIASVSFLAHDPAETPLAARARGLHSNNGRLGSVIGVRPDLVVTGGGVNRFARELAARTGMRVVDVAPPDDIAGLRANIRTVAAALGNPARGAALIAWMDARLGTQPKQTQRAAMLAAGGLTPSPASLTGMLLRHAGIAQVPAASGRITLERLTLDPALPLIVGDYRPRQFSMAESWLRAATKNRARKTVHVDGRLWTCPSPLAAADVERLRRAFAS